MQSKQTYVFHIQGMHCASCGVRIEEALRALSGVESVHVSFGSQQVTVVGVFSGTTEGIAAELSQAVQGTGYTISVKKKSAPAVWSEFLYAIPAALILVVGFVLLQKAGLADLITTSEVSYGTAFIIGLIASVSSCLAVVGGLVLSLSASSAREGGTWRTQTLFHIGRIGGFFVLGGLVGMAGNAFHLSLTVNIVLGIFVSLVMLVLGINLLDVFHFAKRLQITMPASLSKRVVHGSRHDHYLAPVLVGIGTFFLPCGFTQSMQLYALSTGNFIQGALTMFVFALGTFPMLAVLSFSSFNITNTAWKGIFFKTAGIIVIVLALVNLSGALVTAGVMNPIFNF